jgi:3',5'-cyclic AMP phosphodiesterase CpdA
VAFSVYAIINQEKILNMKIFTRLTSLFLPAVISLFAFVSCTGSGNGNDSPPSGRFITGVIVSPQTEFVNGMEYIFRGNGFKNGDKIFFETGTDSREMTVTAVSNTELTIEIAELEDGEQYRIVIRRGEQSQTLGSTVARVSVLANLALPAEIRGACGDPVTIPASGFLTGDVIVFSQAVEAQAGTVSVSDTGITVTIPYEVDNGTATIKLRRGGKEYILGETTLMLTISLVVSDKPGATIKGVVYSGGRPLSGVGVSDGDLIVQTDENGRYWLNSAKRNKQVFVIQPSGFRAMGNGAMGGFWATTTQTATTVEQFDFALSPVSDDRHTIVAFTDAHLANRNTPKDYLQFRDGIVNELNAAYGNEGNVIGLNLGDLSWDQYWYANSFGLTQSKDELMKLDIPVFSVMGNHDNDPYVPGDFAGAETYRKTMGPVYYSMNIGEVHYIMLDDIIWTNTGGREGVVGDRAYSTGLDNEQFAWLQKDIALVDAGTPVIVCFHIPCISYSGVSGVKYTKSAVTSSMNRVVDLLKGKFGTVHFLTGHTHVNRNITIDGTGAEEVREHNIVGASATWWWTNQYTAPDRINIATDGSPGGYKIFEVDGKDIKWRLKMVGQPEERQFVAFDMNEVKKYWTSDPKALQAFTYSDFAGRKSDYNSIGANEVLINVWGFEQDFWTIEVKEGSTSLAVDAVWLYCPLHTISYDIPRRASGSTLTFPSNTAMHMYRVKTSSATSALEITVKDRFGNTCRETMTRPKPLVAAIQ